MKFSPETADAYAKEPTEVESHATPSPDACAHDFKGWREFEDGHGGEMVCTKCGLGALAYTLRSGF